MNKILSSGLFLGAMMSLVGCGGGSDDPKEEVAATGTAYYIDSAVSGVNYTCGSQEGITGANGEFTFEVGQSCTFYLGDMELRGVDAGLLIDGESVYETDVNIARILQSLDSDGNPDNGITIEAATVQALANEGITSLPTTDAEMDEMLAVIAANGGTEVSESDAAEHMFTTLLGGKTFYVVGQEVSDATDIWGGEATFNADLTTLTYTESYAPDAGETEILPISIDGNRLVFGNDTDGSYTVIGENKGDYIEVTDYYSDGTIESHTRLYFDKTKAEAYFATLGGGSSSSDLSALIVGKTFYQHCQDSEGDWIATLTFGEDGNLVMVDGGETETVPYRIEGDMVYVTEDGVEKSHTVTEVTANYIKFGNDADGIFYFTSEAAQATPAVDCGGEDEGPFIFSTDYLNGKILYYVQYNDFGHDEQIGFNVAEMTFNSDGTMIWNEIETIDSGAFNTTYSVDENGHLFLFADQDEGSGEYSYTSQTSDYIKVCQIGNNDCNTYFFFDKQKALDFRDSQN